MSGYAGTENNGGPPVVLSRDPVPRPDLQRDADGAFRVDCSAVIEVVDIVSPTIATVVARHGEFIVTYHRAVYVGWYSGKYGRLLAADTVVTWEHVPAQ